MVVKRAREPITKLLKVDSDRITRRLPPTSLLRACRPFDAQMWLHDVIAKASRSLLRKAS
jgi:hypothetical protein